MELSLVNNTNTKESVTSNEEDEKKAAVYTTNTNSTEGESDDALNKTKENTLSLCNTKSVKLTLLNRRLTNFVPSLRSRALYQCTRKFTICFKTSIS